MSYDEWEASVPAGGRDDACWNVRAYRTGLYLADRAWLDAELLSRDARGQGLAGQLCKAAGSIPANIAEGYGRRSPSDRVRYFEYALGSAAETRAWYLSARRALDCAVLDDRLVNLTAVSRLLLAMIKSERTKKADWMSSPARQRQRGD